MPPFSPYVRCASVYDAAKRLVAGREPRYSSPILGLLRLEESTCEKAEWFFLSLWGKGGANGAQKEESWVRSPPPKVPLPLSLSRCCQVVSVPGTPLPPSSGEAKALSHPFSYSSFTSASDVPQHVPCTCATLKWRLRPAPPQRSPPPVVRTYRYMRRFGEQGFLFATSLPAAAAEETSF